MDGDGDRGRDLLYDDSSAEIFAAALLSVYCIPALLQRIHRYVVVEGVAGDTRRRSSGCGCEPCHLKAEGLRLERRRWYNTWGRPANVVFCVAWCALLLLAWNVSRAGHQGTAPFDPFDILGIDADATEREISKAYRAQSLLYHPDKNLGDPDAADRFVKINKAYEALTDETSRENYQKYGNPDGFQGTKFGVALPSWFAEQGVLVVAAYLVCLVLVFPILVRRWWSSRSQRMNDQVLTTTFFMYRQTFAHMCRFRDIITAYSSAYEFEDYFKKETYHKTLRVENELRKTNKFALKTARFFGTGSPQHFQVQSVILVNAYLARMPLPPEFQAALDSVLRHTEPLTRSLADGVATLIRDDCRAIYTHRSYMNGFTRRLMTAIHVSQCLCQALGERDSPLLQIPHFTTNEVKHCTTKSKNIKTVYDFSALGDERRREILRQFTDTQLLDVNEFCLRYPEVEIESEDPCVEEESDPTVHARDRATVRAKILVRRGTGSAETPCLWRLPEEKHEVWWVILSDDERDLVLDCKRLVPGDADEQGNYNVELHFWAPVAGKYLYKIHALCDCYVGCDRYKQVKLTVLDPVESGEVPVYFDPSDESDYDPEDEDDDEDDDEDEDEDEEDDEDEDENDEADHEFEDEVDEEDDDYVEVNGGFED